MIPHIEKLKIYISALLIVFIYSCGESQKTEGNQFATDKLDTRVSNHDIGIDTKYLQYKFYTSHFQSGGESDLPEVSEEEIADKFREVILLVSKDTVSLNGVKSFYSLDEMDSKKFFGREYVYNYNVDLFKNFFDIDLKSRVSYMDLDVNNNDLSPFKEYFLEAGDAIYMKDQIFLNYKRYIISFIAEDKRKKKEAKLCELPFNFERVYRLCQKDNRSLYNELCDNEYPLTHFKDNSEFLEKIKMKLKNKTPLFYYSLNIDTDITQLIVVVTETEEESYGDQFIFSLKDNEVLELLSNNKDDFFHSRNFKVNKDHTIEFYKNDGLHPKETTIYVYKMNKDGKFSML